MKQSGLMQRQQEREDAALMAGIRIGVQYAIDTLNISLNEADGWGYDHADPRKWMNYGGAHLLRVLRRSHDGRGRGDQIERVGGAERWQGRLTAR